MSKTGKTSIIFLVVFLVLLLCLTGIILFFFQKEYELRTGTQAKLAASEESCRNLEKSLTEAQQKIAVLEQRAKETDEKINDLMDNLDLEQGLKEELKKENLQLTDQIQALTQEKQAIEEELTDLRDSREALASELSSEKQAKEELLGKIKSMEDELEQMKTAAPSATDVSLDKIVVTPNEGISLQGQAGRILKVNAENNFIIVNLGSAQGLAEGMNLQILRAGTLLGNGRVARVQKSMSVADILDPLTAQSIQVTDTVSVVP